MKTRHHIKAIQPALAAMRALGFSATTCFEGTGIDASQLDGAGEGISLKQELAFHRRLLLLANDPLIGLKLGEAYRLESYGVLGYAMLSSATLGDALALATEFDLLTFTHFKIKLLHEGEFAILALQQQGSFAPDLLQLYEDRELAAMIAGGEYALGYKLQASKVHLMHDHGEQQTRYEGYFSCPVAFNCPETRFYFDAQQLKVAMPLRDPETSHFCREQCARLLASLTHSGGFAEEVRQRLISAHRAFPKIEELAQSIHISARTLRRKLAHEGCSYQGLVNEIRYTLALDYLKAGMRTEGIAELLGYSDASNFSHAFKRWHGCSPSQFRGSS